MSMFQTDTINAQRNGSTIATGIPIQLDTVNVDLILNSQGAIPTDSYDAYCEWLTYLPQRGDYLISQTSGLTYQVFGNPAVYTDHWEARVTKYLGTTP